MKGNTKQRPTCKKCGGWLVHQEEWHSGPLPVIRCMCCGWRIYRNAHIPEIDDFESNLELIATICGWRW